MQPFTLLIKPSGSDCNMACPYCFYAGRSEEIGQGRQRMSEALLETLMRDYMSLPLPFYGFGWQGGEPTLMGLDFYKRAVDLQQQYGSAGREVSNALQTNALLLDEAWCRFLHEHHFLVGISIDGPQELHDHYRLDLAGHGTFDRVMAAIERCRSHRVEFNTLTLINNLTATEPEAIFDFLLDLGVRHMQFIPCVEVDPKTGDVADFSVRPDQYGDFLCRLFDRWVAFGPEKLSIRDFDSLLSFCIEGRHSVCTFERHCAQYIVIEHNGDAFPCDFFVEPKWRLGNIGQMRIDELATGAAKRTFAQGKRNLPTACLIVCRGGCVKNRIPFEGGSRPPRDYFCASHKQFFDYAMPRLSQLAAKIRLGDLVRPEHLGG